MKKYLILFLAVLSLVSCRKQVAGYESPTFEAKPVLNSVLTLGEPVWAQVSLAQGLDSVHIYFCKDAEVLLFVNGEFAERLRYDSERQLYVGATVAECGKQYTCKVGINGFDTVEASTTIPPIPVLKDVEILAGAYVNNEGESLPAFLLTFATDPSRELYYDTQIDAEMHYCDGIKSVDYMGHMNFSPDTDDPVLLNEGSEYLVFSNNIINQNEYTLKVNPFFNSMSSCWYGNYDEEIVEPLHGKLVVHMDGLSESLYNYMKSYYTYIEHDAHDNLFLGVTTPFNHYSNVENGYGIFGARACYVSDTVHYNEELRIKNAELRIKN